MGMSCETKSFNASITISFVQFTYICTPRASDVYRKQIDVTLGLCSYLYGLSLATVLHHEVRRVVEVVTKAQGSLPISIAPRALDTSSCRPLPFGKSLLLVHIGTLSLSTHRNIFQVKVQYMPRHIFIGTFTYFAAAFTCVLGIQVIDK